jgi:putative membrane protein
LIITKNIRLTRIIIGTWKNLLILILICILAYFFNIYFLKKYFEFPSIIPFILGPALAFFIGFNNNQAYDRWWEARKIWGALVNDSRSWARQMVYNSSAGQPENENDLNNLKRRMVFRHIAFLYTLKDVLRGEKNNYHNKFLTPKEAKSIQLDSNIPNALLNIQSKDLEYMYRMDYVDGYKFIEFNKMIINFCDEMGMSERIKNTVFPSTYIFYTRLFIWFLIISVTFVTSDLVGAWAIIIGIFVGYVFLVTHIIGLAILNPFEPTPSGISLDQITRTIEINLLETLGESNIPEPIKSVNNEYIM